MEEQRTHRSKKEIKHIEDETNTKSTERFKMVAMVFTVYLFSLSLIMKN